MASPHLLLTVSYRDIPIYSPARLRDVDGSGGFLETNSPMPVGTMLILSPVANASIKVPARVALAIEACRAAGAQAELPGMSLVFEAAGETLLPYLQTEIAPAPAAAPQVEQAESVSPNATMLGYASPASAAEPAPEQVVELEPEPEPAPPVSASSEAPPVEVTTKVVVDEEKLAELGEAVELEAEYDDSEPVAEATVESDDDKKKKKRSRARRKKR